VPLPLLPAQNYLLLRPSCYSTPLKPYSMSPHATLPQTSTIRRTAPRRGVPDREAMKQQLVDCVGMSARKKVLESGRKPKILNIFSSKSGRRENSLGSTSLPDQSQGPVTPIQRCQKRGHGWGRIPGRILLRAHFRVWLLDKQSRQVFVMSPTITGIPLY
jgi:hypothetical protein